MTTLTAAELDSLEALLAKATPGEWEQRIYKWQNCVHFGEGVADSPITLIADAAFIVALHNSAPALIRSARRVTLLETAMSEQDKVIAELTRRLEVEREKSDAREAVK